MKMEAALKMIMERERGGYRVHFERRENGMLHSDMFPERGEETIPDEEQAWALAEKFAAVDPKKYVNIYVIDRSFSPVSNYDSRRFNRH